MLKASLFLQYHPYSFCQKNIPPSSLLWTYLNLFEHYLKLSVHIWTYQNPSKRIWTYPNVSEHIQTYLNISKVIWTYPKLSLAIPTLSKLIGTSLNAVYSLPFLVLSYCTNALSHNTGSKQIFDNLWSS